MRRVLNAPMGFFLMTPVGDLLLNFTKDQDILDENLPDAMHFMGIYGLILVSTTITVSVSIEFFVSGIAGQHCRAQGLVCVRCSSRPRAVHHVPPPSPLVSPAARRARSRASSSS